MRKIFLIIGIVAILFLYGCGTPKNSFGPLGSAHIHTDIKVYVLGNPIDFSLPKYQLQDKAVHFEDGDGDVVHIHATGITLGYIFKTLRMGIDDQCLTLDTGRKHCNNGNAELKVFVKSIGTNWEQIAYPADYIIQGMDKILVNYGSEDEEGIKKLMESVTSKAK
jgi:hypothetical protein